MHNQPRFWLYVARLKYFSSGRYVRNTVIFNITFIYIWGYLLWGTMPVGSFGWWLEEFGHLWWSGYHTWISLSYMKQQNENVFDLWRWKEERIIWWRVILLSVFCWEGLERWHDWSGLFETIAQIGNTDTMTDIFFSGVIAPCAIIVYRRWSDGVKLFFADPEIKKEKERNLRIAIEALSLVADLNEEEEPQAMRQLHGLVKKTWKENHRILPVLETVRRVARGSRRERKRRRMLVEQLKQKG